MNKLKDLIERKDEEFEEMRTTSYEDPLVISDGESEQIKELLHQAISEAFEQGRRDMGEKKNSGSEAKIIKQNHEDNFDQKYKLPKTK